MGRPHRPLILAYHGVTEVPVHRDPHGLFVAPAQLRRQIRTLRRWGYELLTFGAIAERVAAGTAAGCAALTFDDGLADNLESLLPVLRDEDVPGTVFVTTGWLGATYPYADAMPMLTADGVRELHASGRVEVGAHTVTHPDLTTLPFDAARAEVAEGRERLEEIIGAPVRTFAYPFGHANPEAIRAVGAAGIDAACRIMGKGSWAEPLNLPRQDMNGKTALGLWLKREERYEPLMRLRAARAVRRAGYVRQGIVSRLRER